MNHAIKLNESNHSEKDTVKEHFHETYQILYALEDFLQSRNKGIQSNN